MSYGKIRYPCYYAPDWDCLSLEWRKEFALPRFAIEAHDSEGTEDVYLDEDQLKDLRDQIDAILEDMQNDHYSKGCE